MESANKVAERRGVLKSASQRDQNPALERETDSRTPSTGGAIENLPSGPGTQSLRQAAMIRMQQTHGNTHVMRQLHSSVQRQEDEAGAAAATSASAEPSSEPSAISGSGGRVDAGGGGVEITGGSVKVHSGMVEADGVVKASTIIADSVVASSYTPGAGNIW